MSAAKIRGIEPDGDHHRGCTATPWRLEEKLRIVAEAEQPGPASR